MIIAAVLLAISLKNFDGVAGYAAMNFENGEWLAYNGEERFPMASVMKLPVAIALLQRVDHEQFHMSDVVTIAPEEFSRGWSPIRDSAHGKTVTMSLGELFDDMLGQSDNTAVDKVLSMIGGPEVATKTMRDLHIKNIRIDRKEDEVGRDATADMIKYSRDPRDTSTPNAMVELLRLIYMHKEGLSKESHELMLKVMSESMTGPHKIREGVPAGSIVAHKTGAMPGTSNDVAIVTSPDGKHHMAIAIFTKGSKQSDAEQDALVRDFARTAYERFTR